MKYSPLKTMVVISIALIALVTYQTLHTVRKTPSTPVQISNESILDNELHHLSLRQKVAKLFIFHKNTQNTEELARFMKTVQPGGLILMKDNIPPTSEALQALTRTIRGEGIFQPLVAIDEEGGVVTRLDEDTLPGGVALAGAQPDTVRDVFKNRSQLLQTRGITLNFGIIADTTNDTSSFMYQRVLGTTPEAASRNVTAAVDGSRGLVLSTVKHFPGHGATAENSHFDIPVIAMGEAEWKQHVLPPFSAAISHGVDVVMFSHLRYSFLDDKPASLSKAWHEMLTQTITPRFNGVSITDDMFMLGNSGDPTYADTNANALQALLAGNTMLLYVTENTPAGTTDASWIDQGKLVDFIVQKVTDGTIPMDLIDKNVRKILDLQRKI